MSYSNASQDKLYGLLPAFIREKDAAQGEPLRALLSIIDEQAGHIDGDIRQLYENAFIETCEPWAVAYLGDLVGTVPLFDESRVRDGDTAAELFKSLTGPSLRPPIALRARADVAKTIYYRRRKGTLPMLEELARDVTGWSAHAVEFFELLGWTQWIRNHLRPHALRTPDIRSVERMDRLGGAFDEIAHTVDVRPIAQDEGWHNIRNIGFFLWRLSAYGLRRGVARRLGAAGDFRFHFSPLGNSAPLFSRSRREGDEAGLATELHVPQPIRPARFFGHIADFYGLFEAEPPLQAADAPSLMVHVDGVPIQPEQVVCRNLSVWSQPSTNHIAVDVARGRLTLGPDLMPANLVEVSYHYGFPADLGGGPYRRRAWLTRPDFTTDVQMLFVDDSGQPGTFPTLGAAITQWAADGKRNAIIRIRDNRSYAETIAIDVTQVGPQSGTTLAIEAADGVRPHLRLGGPLAVSGDRPDFALTLGGLLIEGRIEIEGSLHRLCVLHSTLVPGVSIAEQDPPAAPDPPEPSILAAASLPTGAPANTELGVELAFSICGPIRLPPHAESLTALDSIIDGLGSDAVAGPGAADSPGPAARLERCTLRGRCLARQFDFVTETIFDGLARADRVQTGCVRFSFVPAGSRTPRRYRCQPDLAERKAITEEEARNGPLTDPQRAAIRAAVRLRLKPEYSAEAYGLPAYLQLSLRGPVEIARGAEDGSEMGVYCHLKQPQREANLRLRLREYLPFGLDYGVIYVT
ncbi:hypothetical protein NB311A_01589 [Nitrobacter sp. Nb-311A]|uniref:hypothetical protein n=1 Tax=unclassified Nitrobacter TaxID=2620411 RepID=UPI0000687F90|nr:MULTISPECIES: hypothetical protein [unclassified Nitrobacter]EAQ36156.1 hypothetical protein NB311A_01589 [Nitrobacter sp. Nb-311A]MCB1391634.1 hypothetical protein [Nitrobacter sp.]MCV0386930.1 hypothetical protein [Nitrobacter sp.]